MKTSSTPRNVMRQRLSFLILGAAIIGLGLILFFTFLIGLNTIPVKKAEGSTNTTFASGSFIIDMGIMPQSVGNGLKPYGLIWDLIEHYSTSVHWVIKPSKAKDGADFTYNGYDYKGGPFIIDVADITPTIAARITYWVDSLGVVGTYTTSAITVPVYGELQYYPKIIIDNLSGNAPIIEAYFDNAGIDSTGYTLGTPADATTCFDLWANPHADPTWATHGPLYKFVTYHKGYIWSECHAVSMLEDVVEPVAPFRQLNYLTTTGLKCWKTTGQSACGPAPFNEGHNKQPTSPYTHSFQGMPVMQFMGKAQSALNSNGSEKWFMPLSGGQWRFSTFRSITTSDGTAPGEGVLMAYGPAYGNPNNGWVMYAGGHNHQGGGTLEAQIAAQRAFFNFVYLAGKERSIIQSSNITTTMTGLNWYAFSSTISGGYPPYNISWTSSFGGTFTQPDSLSTAFIPPNLTGPTTGTISLTVTDSCSRTMAVTQLVTVTPSPLPVTLKEFTATPKGMDMVVLKWITASEDQNKYFTIHRSKDGHTFTKVADVPSKGDGVTDRSYTLTDMTPYKGVSSYRLSQTDNNGTVTYFDPVSVNLNQFVVKDLVSIGPNPFVDHLNLNYNGKNKVGLKAGLYDIHGKLISEKKFDSTSGAATIRFNNLGALPKGHYILKVDDNNDLMEVFRLVK
jgi:type IX secretion system substrate protein